MDDQAVGLGRSHPGQRLDEQEAGRSQESLFCQNIINIASSVEIEKEYGGI
jgi:hypothetical protein